MKNINFLKKNLEIYKSLLDKIDLGLIRIFSNELKKIKKDKKKVLVFGNGAGAAISSHFCSDLAKTLNIKALSFDNSAQITCFSNDYKFENCILETIKVYFNTGDLILLLSASGKSMNMINAAKYCKKNSIKFYSLTGFNVKNPLNKLSKKKFHIQSNNYNQVEVIQNLILLLTIDFLNKKIK